MDPLEQEEEEPKKKGRRRRRRRRRLKKKTEEEEQEEKDVEGGKAGTSAEERKLEGLLRKLMTFQDNLENQLKQNERQSKEILGEVEREVQEQLEKVKVLIRVGAGKGLVDFPRRRDFVNYYICTRNETVQKICQGILDVLINEDTAQHIFDWICDFADLEERFLTYSQMFESGASDRPTIFASRMNYLACCNLLKWCIDKSACPTTYNIKNILTRKIFSTSDVLFAFLQLMEQLIKTHRNHGNSDPIEVYLNPMQDFYKVSEELRAAASRVIRAAYCALSNCLESGSLINTLLFLDSGVIDDDDAVIKEWFVKADMKYSLSIDANDQTMNKIFKSTRKIEDEFSRKNYNLLQRNVLHLVAIFVHNDRVLNLIPKEFIEKAKDGRDFHGCTPLHTAYLHGNKSVILLLESCEAKLNAIADYFGRTPESFKVPYEYNEDNHTEYCRKITTITSSVYAMMKKVLILPVNECEAIEENFKALFEMMVSQDGHLNTAVTVRIAGSIREKLKVGRFNEVDLQLCMEYNSQTFSILSLHDRLVKSMAVIDWSQISLRPIFVSTRDPWKFILEREGSYNGLVISVDVVPISIILTGEDQSMYLNLILKNARRHSIQRFEKIVPSRCVSSKKTICEHEWDILDNLPPGCRLGILISKALLEVLDQVSENDRAFTKAPITSYVIKNTVFWILAGKTPQNPENIIGERYGHLKQQLVFKGTIPTWTTEEDLERYGEEGRIWAEAIFDVIHFMAKNCGRIVGSFFFGEAKSILPQQLYDVLDTCERCLERLRPCVFFDEKTMN